MYSKTNMVKRNESGRSMLEVIGVLAIVGVLTSGGVLGYRYAMDKYRATSTINEMNKRSLIYSQQSLVGNKELSQTEFKNTTDMGYPISVNLIEKQPYFRIELTNVPKRVCQNIVNAEWYLPMALYVNGRPDTGNGVDCPIKENKMAFYFHWDLKEEAWDYSSDSSDFSDFSDTSDSSDSVDWQPEETVMFICQSNNDCSWPLPVCNTETGACEKCTTNNDCSRFSYYPVCNTETGACEKCATNNDCFFFPDKPVCLETQGRCVECLANGDCSNNAKGEICNTSNNTCRLCKYDSDCNGQPNGNICDKQTGKCVECLDNLDCNNNANGNMCLIESKICGQCETRSCSDDSQCGDNEVCSGGQCTCPNGFWINNCACSSCPEGSTPIVENDALSCKCPETFTWRNGECVPCVNEIHNLKGTFNQLGEGIDQCNNSCPTGYYTKYDGSSVSKVTATCKKIQSFSIDSMSDEALWAEYNKLLTYSGYEGSLSADEKNAFGVMTNGAQVRERLHELLDKYYIPLNSDYWIGAQSWCRAQGANLVSREEYFRNGLRFAVGFAAGWSDLRFWADGAVFGSGWDRGRSTTWQSGGWDSFNNGLWFICEK